MMSVIIMDYFLLLYMNVGSINTHRNVSDKANR